MRFLACAIVLAGGLTMCPTARAQDPTLHWWNWPWSTERHPCPSCPDDYVRKAMPKTPCMVRPTDRDDYGRKPLPPTTCIKCGGVDDYCRKDAPITLPPCYPSWYTCGPSAPCDCNKK